MALRQVRQENYTGCFVAGVAMLLGVPYKAAYFILHPGKDPVKEQTHGIVGTSMFRRILNGEFSTGCTVEEEDTPEEVEDCNIISVE